MALESFTFLEAGSLQIADEQGIDFKPEISGTLGFQAFAYQRSLELYSRTT